MCIKWHTVCHSGCHWSRLIAHSRAVAFGWLRCCLSLEDPHRCCCCFLLLLALPGKAMAALLNSECLLDLSSHICPFMAWVTLECCFSSLLILYCWWCVSNTSLLFNSLGTCSACSVLQPSCDWVGFSLATLKSPKSPVGCCIETNSESVRSLPETLG